MDLAQEAVSAAISVTPRLRANNAYDKQLLFFASHVESIRRECLPCIPDTVSFVLLRKSTLLSGVLFTPLASTRTEHIADVQRVWHLLVALQFLPLTPRYAILSGNRSRSEARLRSRDLDSIGAPLRPPARIHGSPSPSGGKQSCWTSRSAPRAREICARFLREFV